MFSHCTQTLVFAKCYVTVPYKMLKIAIANDSELFDFNNLFTKRPGFFVEVTQLICLSLDWLCEFQITSEHSRGTKKNGSWTGTLGEIQKGNYNTSVPHFTPFNERLEDFDFADFLFIYPLSFVVPNPKLYAPSQIWSFARPFGVYIWTLLFFTTATLSVVVSVSTKPVYKKKETRFITHYLNILTSLLTFISRKSFKINVGKRKITKLILMVWGFASVVITASYCGSLWSFLLRSDSSMPFKNFGTMVDCVAKKKCFMTIDPSNRNLFMKIFGSSHKNSDTFRLYKALSSGQSIDVNTVVDGLNLIRATKDRYVFTMMYDYLGSAIVNRQTFDDLLAFNSDLSDYITFPFRKNDTLKHVFTRELNKLSSLGLLQQLNLKYFGKRQKLEVEKSRSNAVLTPLHVSGPLVMLLFGSVLGLLLLLLENVL